MCFGSVRFMDKTKPFVQSSAADAGAYVDRRRPPLPPAWRRAFARRRLGGRGPRGRRTSGPLVGWAPSFLPAEPLLLAGLLAKLRLLRDLALRLPKHLPAVIL